jgi:serine/threonine protein kinase
MKHPKRLQRHIVWNPFRRRPRVTIYTSETNGIDVDLFPKSDLFDQPGCRIIKNEKKIKVGFMQMRIGEDIKTVYIKQHNALSLGHRVACLFLPSAARRALSGAVSLLGIGCATAQPVAALEYRKWGVLIKSLYVAEALAGAETVDSFWQEHLGRLRGVEGYRKRRAFLRELAKLFSLLHAKGIYHNDLKADNILIRASEALPQDVFHVIDLQGLRRCFYVSMRRRVKNVAQLNRSFGPLLSNTQKLYFLTVYTHFSGSHETKHRGVIMRILLETQRQLARKHTGRLSREESLHNHKILQLYRFITRTELRE